MLAAPDIRGDGCHGRGPRALGHAAGIKLTSQTAQTGGAALQAAQQLCLDLETPKSTLASSNAQKAFRLT
jgi:hypothetical protein